jgi:hypothetical protein
MELAPQQVQKIHDNLLHLYIPVDMSLCVSSLAVESASPWRLYRSMVTLHVNPGSTEIALLRGTSMLEITESGGSLQRRTLPHWANSNGSPVSQVILASLTHGVQPPEARGAIGRNNSLCKSVDMHISAPLTQ